MGGNGGANFPGPIAWALASYGPDAILQYDNDKNAPDPADQSQVYYPRNRSCHLRGVRKSLESRT